MSSLPLGINVSLFSHLVIHRLCLLFRVFFYQPTNCPNFVPRLAINLLPSSNIVCSRTCLTMHHGFLHMFLTQSMQVTSITWCCCHELAIRRHRPTSNNLSQNSPFVYMQMVLVFPLNNYHSVLTAFSSCYIYIL